MPDDGDDSDDEEADDDDDDDQCLGSKYVTAKQFDILLNLFLKWSWVVWKKNVRTAFSTLFYENVCVNKVMSSVFL